MWARSPEVAQEINQQRSNSTYLPGFELPPTLRATVDLEQAVSSAEVLIVAIPAHGFRASLTQAIPYIHPWIPVVSLTKGLEQGTICG